MACSTLDVTVFILRRRRSTLEESCCLFFANRIVRAASSGDKWLHSNYQGRLCTDGKSESCLRMSIGLMTCRCLSLQFRSTAVVLEGGLFMISRITRRPKYMDPPLRTTRPTGSRKLEEPKQSVSMRSTCLPQQG